MPFQQHNLVLAAAEAFTKSPVPWQRDGTRSLSLEVDFGGFRDDERFAKEKLCGKSGSGLRCLRLSVRKPEVTPPPKEMRENTKILGEL